MFTCVALIACRGNPQTGGGRPAWLAPVESRLKAQNKIREEDLIAIIRSKVKTVVRDDAGVEAGRTYAEYSITSQEGSYLLALGGMREGDDFAAFFNVDSVTIYRGQEVDEKRVLLKWPQ